jgi:preprotein translocase subunit SecE
MSVSEYIKETRGEIKHVSWPTRRQAVLYTITVILISVGVALYLGLFDYIFEKLLQKLVVG